MIVFDTSTLVGVAMRQDSTPARALSLAFRTDKVAVSEAVLAELLDVLFRPKLARFIDPALRIALLNQLSGLSVPFSPDERVTDCRDPKDDIYLELALASDARTIVSSDRDLLVLSPWRGVRILRPADYLAEAERDV